MTDELDAAEELLNDPTTRAVNAKALTLGDVQTAIDGLTDPEAEAVANKLKEITAQAADSKDLIRRAANALLDFAVERLT